MNWQLPRNSLFSILLRSPWWVSVLVGAGIFAAARLILDAGFAAFAASPFVVIAALAGRRQLGTPGAGRIAKTLERLRGLPWEGFCGELEAAWKRGGYAVSRPGVAQVDFELARAGRVTLVGCKRWKAVRTGVEPLREFHAAAERREAHERIYVAAGEVTDKASAFAAQNNIRLVQGAELVRLVG
ncbi:MAG: restriction endonuclease [Betaproteobacteria bacterium]|nr:MAG: restriction endonuclease [Betaproteobacteria bacterium]